MSQKPPKARGAPEAARTEDPPSPITLIRNLKSGALDASALSPDSRRACVEHLTAEGYSASEISEIFKISPRTVYRDLHDIRRANAIERDPRLAEEFSGDLMLEARHAIARLRRIGRDRECPHATRVEAERNAWIVMRELTEILQRLGFLPTAAQEIRADLTHRIEESPSLEELEAEFQSMESVVAEVFGKEAAKVRLASLSDELARCRVGEELRALREQVKPGAALVATGAKEEAHAEDTSK